LGGQVPTWNGDLVDTEWKLPGEAYQWNDASTGLPGGAVASAISVLPSSSFIADNAFNGDISTTYWESDVGGPPYWLKIDFGTDKTIERWEVYNQSSTGQKNRAYELQWSTDNSSWTTIDSITGNTATHTDRFLASGGATAQYWRLYITQVGTVSGNAYVNQFVLYDKTPFSLLGVMGITGLPSAGNTLVADDSNNLHWGTPSGDAITLQTVDVEATTPTNGDVLTYSSTSSSWGPAAPTGGGSTFVGAHVYHSANQTISNTTDTYLAFNSERFDTDAFHDTSTNNSRLTIPTGLGGKYVISCNVRAPSASGLFQLTIKKNGTTSIAVATIPFVGGYTLFGALTSTVVSLSAGDYVQAQVYQETGGNLDVLTGAEYSPEFSIYKVG
jgi:hypothetical protein